MFKKLLILAATVLGALSHEVSAQTQCGSPPTVNVVSAASYTLTGNDNCNVVVLNSSSATTVTINKAGPTTNAYSTVIQALNAAATLSPQAGTTINGSSSYTIPASGSAQVVLDKGSGNWYVASGPGTSGMLTSASNATLPAALTNLGLPTYNVVAYGAKCDDSTDDTTAINNAAAALRSNGYGILYSPPERLCKHTGTLNLTNFNSPTATGAAPNYRTIISIHTDCSVVNGVCWDAIGSKHTTWQTATLMTPTRGGCTVDDAAIGLQIGRPNTTQTASQQDFQSPYIDGCFSQSALINFGSEVTKVFGGVIDNGSLTAGSHNVRIDCDNHFNNLASSFTTISWSSGSFTSCNDISFHGTTSQKFGVSLTATGGSGNTISFASVPSWVTAGQIVRDSTTSTNLANGAAVVSKTATTVTLTVSAASVTNGDGIVFSSPDPALWLDGTDGFSWDGNGYISVGSQYAVTIFYEAAHPPLGVHLPVHMESYPNLVADILLSGTAAAPSVFDLQRYDILDEASFAVIVPDFANNVTSFTLDRHSMVLAPAGGVTATFKDWGTYQGLATATTATGGSGCTNSLQTFTLQNGTTGVGVAATATATPSGGSISGALTVATAGSYIFTPGTTVTLSGGGCSVAPTITATYSNLATQTPVTVSGSEIISSASYRSTPASNYSSIVQDGTGSNATIRFQGPNWTWPNLANNSTTATPICKNSGNSVVLCTQASYSTTGTTLSGTLTVSGITTDATHTDATVCEDTTSHQFYFGSGAAGICLGTSSLRFKKDVAPLAAGLSDVLRLEPIAYRYRDRDTQNPNRLYGFAAEQVVTVMPELVGLDIEGKPNSVDWAGVIPVLVNAIKEQQREIDALKSEIKHGG